MDPYTPFSAAVARSLVRRSWTENMKGKYDKLVNELYHDIESAAKNGCTGYVFGLIDEPHEAVLIAAEELRAEGFTVIMGEDYNELKIDWAQE